MNTPSQVELDAHAPSGTDGGLASQAARSLADPRLIQGRDALHRGDLGTGARLFDAMLAGEPANPIARCLRAEVELRQGRFGAAEQHFRQSVAVAPGYLDALHGLAYSLFQQVRMAEAMLVADRMLVMDPVNLPARLLKAGIAAHIGDHEEAILLYQGVVAQRPDHVPSWLALGHSYRAVGVLREGIAAYHRALAIDPACGEAWGCLASLKTYAFTDSELAAMLDAAGRQDMPPGHRTHLQFALGKAFFDRGDDRQAFLHYAQANALARAQQSQGPLIATGDLPRWVETTIAALGRAGADRDTESVRDSAPIFIVGMPRSGTTLVEQILGSHSQIEALGELPYVEVIVRRLLATHPDLSAIDMSELASEYLQAARIHRKTAKPRFVDKLPGNYAHIALIQAMFPGAPIIDVRRHPLASCAAVFRQHFLGMPELSGSLADIARVYRGYAQAMKRFDEAMPGAVHHLFYEELVEDTESEVRRLLECIGAGFEESCLHWYENGQPIRTPSSEQVRQPMFRHGLDQWRRFEGELGEARKLLVEEADSYPD